MEVIILSKYKNSLNLKTGFVSIINTFYFVFFKYMTPTVFYYMEAIMDFLKCEQNTW